jgi:protocatechuate 3,4-dioxygenase beta subunit
VRDDTGRPVAGAVVNEGASASTYSAADGSYTLSLVAGDHWINAFTNDESFDTGSNILLVPVPAASASVDFVLSVRNRTIQGRVTDDQGQPLADATVFATNPLKSTGQARDTAADGTYSLTVPAGVYWVYVVKYPGLFDPVGHIPFEPSRSQAVDVSATSAQDINFALKPVSGLQPIHGRVLDHQGGPVSAVVTAAPVDQFSCNPRESVITDESGAYTLTVKPGAYLISMHSEGLPALPNQTVSVPTAAAVDFTYPPLYTLSGRVTDATGKPLRHVLAQASTSAFDGLYNSSLSDDDGYYSVIVAAGSYTITAYHQAYNVPPAQVMTVLPEHNDINFVLSPVVPPDQVLRGVVLDETGRPAANAVVSLAGELFSGETVYYDGSFARAVYPGTYTVYAGGYGYASSVPQQVTVPPGPTALTFTVRRADQFIFGQVTDEAGNPLCGVNVEATGEAAFTTALTNSSGRFAMRVPTGSYTIRALAAGYPTASAEMVTGTPAASQLELVMAKTVQEPGATRFVYLPAVTATR